MQCPNPDCKQIFAIKTNDSIRRGLIVQCPACEASIEIEPGRKPSRYTLKTK